jgi:serine/threonine protein kinase/class 3 adenylate cyclase/formylglycine-generating enzyme required for sulfatase activity/cephalosporin-C deacetylase-like acetyl esterase
MDDQFLLGQENKVEAFGRKHRTGLVTILFTDMVDSTALKHKLGDRAASDLFRKHDELIRKTLQECPRAEEIETAGDSFLLIFLTPSEAVEFALLIQSRMRRIGEGNVAETLDRIGIHVGEVVVRSEAESRKPKDVFGIQVDTCSRVMSLAKAGQVLMTRSVFDSARQVLKGDDIEGVGQLEWLNHGPYLLKGLEEAIEICEVREAGQSDFSAPINSEKAQRRVAPGDEPVLGWRPAVGQLIPNSKWLLQEKLGEGGFGEVWLGLHQTMKERRVFKFCFQAERIRFLKRELTLFRLLKDRIGDHPNVVRVHEVFLDHPPCYVEMDYVDGRDLRNWCTAQGGIETIPLPTRLEIIAQVAEALKAAHDSGIIHRDVKPTNILVSGKGMQVGGVRIKLTDFGIGQVVSQECLAGLTRAGFTETLSPSGSSSQSGTHLYMAPELLAGRPASIQSDIYSLGIVLYQLLVEDFSEPLTTDWQEKVFDPALREDLKHCFAGEPSNRFAHAALLAQNLRSLEERQKAFSTLQRKIHVQKQTKAVALIMAILLLSLTCIWSFYRSSKARWARATLPQISALADAEKFSEAFELARKAEMYLANDPALTNLIERISNFTSFETTPPGADVYIKEASNLAAPWQVLGKTPIPHLRVARGRYRWRLAKEGYESVERGFWLNGGIQVRLDAIGSIPPGMVRVEGETNSSDDLLIARGAPATDFGDFLLDKFEVSNRRFKEFVDAGGYQKTNFWLLPFFKEGSVISWNEALSLFRDKTGQLGPATWLNGSYPPGQGDYPVAGVSWYEAAAYAQFAGKTLPTVYHWEKAVDPWASPLIVPLSNFSKQGPAPVGKYQGMSPWGAYDMAGNVAEWCWNESGPGKRYVLGAAWDDREYRAMEFDQSDPFDRVATRGFRCMKDLSAAGSSQRTMAAVAPLFRDYAREKPVSDEVFQAYKDSFSYDRGLPLVPVVKVEEHPDSWKRERVSFKAAYRNETVTAFLFLPKKASPPFQTFVYFPGSGAFSPQSSASNLKDFDIVEALLRSGRAVLYPVYKGSYERASVPMSPIRSSTEIRDMRVEQAKDFLRSVDYLLTRSDIDHDKLGYAGLSYGGAMAPLLLALEDRMRIAILHHGGLPMRPFKHEVDPLNFVQHVTIPVLMINGRLDAAFPPATSQLPLYRLLGTPPEHKLRREYETGHGGPPLDELTKQVSEWVDKYWGSPQ